MSHNPDDNRDTGTENDAALWVDENNLPKAIKQFSWALDSMKYATDPRPPYEATALGEVTIYLRENTIELNNQIAAWIDDGTRLNSAMKYTVDSYHQLDSASAKKFPDGHD